MRYRRPTATVLVAALLPLAAALTSCGFNYKTDQINTIAAGVNNREGDVDVLGARIVAYSQGQGRLIGALVYNVNDADKPAQLTQVQGDGIDPVQVQGIEVAPGGHVNLAADDAPAVAVTGDFTAGDVLPLSYTFSTGEVATLDVPVVKPCRQYAEITAPEGAAASDSESASPSASASTEPDATFLCDHPTPSSETEEGSEG
jgi:hypothetical protein